MNPIHTVFIGETNKRLSATLKDADGAAVDLAGSTVRMIYWWDGVDPVEKDCELDPETTGGVYYDWTTEDFEDFGEGDGYFYFVRTVTATSKEDYFPCYEDGSIDKEIYLTLRSRRAPAP